MPCLRCLSEHRCSFARFRLPACLFNGTYSRDHDSSGRRATSFLPSFLPLSYDARSPDFRGIQVDVTAVDASVPGKIPAINQQAAATAQTTGMINTALQHMGLGPDPWKAIKVGVGHHMPP